MIKFLKPSGGIKVLLQVRNMVLGKMLQIKDLKIKNTKKEQKIRKDIEEKQEKIEENIKNLMVKMEKIFQMEKVKCIIVKKYKRMKVQIRDHKIKTQNKVGMKTVHKIIQTITLKCHQNKIQTVLLIISKAVLIVGLMKIQNLNRMILQFQIQLIHQTKSRNHQMKNF